MISNEYCLALLGVADKNWKLHGYIKTVHYVIDTLTQAGATVAVLSGPGLIGGASGDPNINSELDQFVEVNRNISAQYNVSYINIRAIFREYAANGVILTADGEHPNRQGSELISSLFANELNSRAANHDGSK
jgi:hypothetical protein